MPQVDFFVPAEGVSLDRLRMVCAVAAARCAQRQGLVVQAGSAQELARLDELLWTCSDISFLAHETIDSEGSGDAPILLAYDHPPVTTVDCLVNLAHPLPDYAWTCTRIIELLDNDEDGKELGRQRYRAYKIAAGGVAPRTVKIRNYDDIAL